MRIRFAWAKWIYLNQSSKTSLHRHGNLFSPHQVKCKCLNTRYSSTTTTLPEQKVSGLIASAFSFCAAWIIQLVLLALATISLDTQKEQTWTCFLQLSASVWDSFYSQQGLNLTSTKTLSCAALRTSGKKDTGVTAAFMLNLSLRKSLKKAFWHRNFMFTIDVSVSLFF